jgi:hypothetical protein
MKTFMTRFVFWSGVYNVGLALILTFPPIYRALGPRPARTLEGPQATSVPRPSALVVTGSLWSREPTLGCGTPGRYQVRGCGP